MMKYALAQAKIAARKNEVPIGAVLCDASGNIIAKAHNLRESRHDPLAHAELLAIAKAAKKLKSWRLLGTTLYITLEPCAMCWGAIVLARIEHVVFGASDAKAGVLGGAMDLAHAKCFNHQPKITAGLMALECAKILSDFFKELRKSKL